MEDPPDDVIIITRSSSQVQFETVESSNPDDVHEKAQAAPPPMECIAMEDPPQSQDTIMNSRGSLQVQSQIVENSNPQLVPEKIQAALQSTTTTSPPAEEVCVDIPLDDPHQDMIINTRSSKEQTTAPLDDEDDDDVQEFLRRVPTHIGEDSSGHEDDEDDDDDDDDIQEFIRRVPTLIREEIGSRYLCEPVMVSIGPYHHNKTQYSEMERLKKCVLDRFMEKSVAKDKTKDRDFYYGKIFERINKIRGYYEGVGPEEYTDEALTELILSDACFLVSYIKSKESVRLKFVKAFGNLLAIPLVERDLWRVENQIPFFIINHLLQLRFGEDKVHEMVRLFVSRICFQDDEKLKRLPWKDEEYQPLHLLAVGCVGVLGTTGEAWGSIGFQKTPLAADRTADRVSAINDDGGGGAWWSRLRGWGGSPGAGEACGEVGEGWGGASGRLWRRQPAMVMGLWRRRLPAAMVVMVVIGTTMGA